MVAFTNSRFSRIITLLITIFSLSLPAYAKYSGGTGEPNDPYQIATAEDLMLLGENPEDYDRHFILTADIDLDPNLPGRRIFDRAVIAWDRDFPFTGVFDGNRYAISNLTITGGSHLGLFGRLDSGAEVRGVGVMDVNITSSGGFVGGLVGSNYGIITTSYSTGTVTGDEYVGGLVGYYGVGTIVTSFSVSVVSGEEYIGGLVGKMFSGNISDSHSMGTVNANIYVGGLVGCNGILFDGGLIAGSYSRSEVRGEVCVGGLVGNNGRDGNVIQSYSSGEVTGSEIVGGLVGCNYQGEILNCYSVGSVSGDKNIGGLVGSNSSGTINLCYSAGMVMGNENVGGLIGGNYIGGPVGNSRVEVLASFWNTQTSGQSNSDGGMGLTTSKMQTVTTFLEAGWDFVGETENGTEDIWKISEGLDYPRLSWEKYIGGTGEPNDPYQIATAEDLMLLEESPEDYDKHFILTADIDLDPNLPGCRVFERAVIAPDVNDTDFYYEFQGIPFTGVFNGNGHIISHLTIDGISNLGLFGQLHEQAVVSNLNLVAVNVNGVYGVGTIVGDNFGGSIIDSYSNGSVNGNWFVGGLVGNNSIGSITGSYSTGVVTGKGDVGGLVGNNGEAEGGVAVLTNCYSTACVSGSHRVGGLAGSNYYKGNIATSYSTGVVTGIGDVGGLVGINFNDVTQSHSTATVSGDEAVGGLVGSNQGGSITTSYSSGDVSGGNWTAGGLVGYNYNGSIATSYNTGTVSGYWHVGGLVGINEKSSINNSYSSGAVTGHGYIGGLVGHSVDSDIAMSYSNGLVTGNEDVGGLVAFNNGSIISSFWDMESSGQTTSAGGEGKNTAEMQTAGTFLQAGWDFVDETVNDTEDIWKISEGFGYPHLWWEPSKYGGGSGDPNHPYLIYTADHLNEMSAEPNDWDKHFKLMADIDLSGYSYDKAVIAPYIGNQDLFKGIPFTGVFDGNGHTISHLTIDGGSLFGLLESGAEVRNIGILDVNIIGSGSEVGGLVAKNQGYVVNCYSTGKVGGDWCVGGLVGNNYGNITNCYSISKVIGNNVVGGLVGINNGVVIHCYSNNTVDGVWLVGGLIGSSSKMDVASCFWNIEISGKTTSAGGTGITTAEMQTASTFMEAGWDFIDETENGTEDIWWIDEGQDYPRLWWEAEGN